MHELSVTESLLEIALRHAEPSGARRITGLNIVIGQFSSIVDDSVQFYWDFVAKNTLAEGALLHFQRVPAQLQCQDCGHSYTPAKMDFACPACGSDHCKITAGEEFYLESMDIEA